MSRINKIDIANDRWWCRLVPAMQTTRIGSDILTVFERVNSIDEYGSKVGRWIMGGRFGF